MGFFQLRELPNLDLCVSVEHVIQTHCDSSFSACVVNCMLCHIPLDKCRCLIKKSDHVRRTYLRVALHTTKSHDLENLRALEIHPKTVPWEMEIQFCNWWALKLSVKWKWIMLRDHNICSGLSPHHHHHYNTSILYNKSRSQKENQLIATASRFVLDPPLLYEPCTMSDEP